MRVISIGKEGRAILEINSASDVAAVITSSSLIIDLGCQTKELFNLIIEALSKLNPHVSLTINWDTKSAVYLSDVADILKKYSSKLVGTSLKFKKEDVRNPLQYDDFETYLQFLSSLSSLKMFRLESNLTSTKDYFGSSIELLRIANSAITVFGLSATEGNSLTGDHIDKIVEIIKINRNISYLEINNNVALSYFTQSKLLAALKTSKVMAKFVSNVVELNSQIEKHLEKNGIIAANQKKINLKLQNYYNPSQSSINSIVVDYEQIIDSAEELFERGELRRETVDYCYFSFAKYLKTIYDALGSYYYLNLIKENSDYYKAARIEWAEYLISLAPEVEDQQERKIRLLKILCFVPDLYTNENPLFKKIFQEIIGFKGLDNLSWKDIEELDKDGFVRVAGEIARLKKFSSIDVDAILNKHNQIEFQRKRNNLNIQPTGEHDFENEELDIKRIRM